MSSAELVCGKTEKELNDKAVEIFESLTGWQMHAGVFVLCRVINSLIAAIYMKDETGKILAGGLLKTAINSLKETHKDLTKEIDKGTFNE